MTVDSTELRYQIVVVDDAEWWETEQVPLQQQQHAPHDSFAFFTPSPERISVL